MYILAFQIVFISLTRQELILHEIVNEKKVLFGILSTTFVFNFLCKIKSCQVIAENRAFFDLFCRFSQLSWQILLVGKSVQQRKGDFN